ncbi:MAG: hypothetical protein KUF79_00885 [Candidatus Thiodiazotropha sp. (ex Ctena orbiculata)]|nr:hypothetical protein [Candidatus Thiodiazotropha taylori]MBV2135343.1 hypothetical protein [Candidatus Thiodiazotropha taylori]
MIERSEDNYTALDKRYRRRKTKLTADSGFYNKNNLGYVYNHKIDAYLPDVGFRKRDPRFQAIEKYKGRNRQEQQKKRITQHYTSPDFLMMLIPIRASVRPGSSSTAMEESSS